MSRVRNQQAGALMMGNPLGMPIMQHMQSMEDHLDNIEALFKELVELQKQK